MRCGVVQCIEPRGSINNFQHHVIIIWVQPHAEIVYGIEGNRFARGLSLVILAGLLFSCVVLAPVFAAVAEDVTVPKSSDALAKDNPEMLASLKTHIAYVSQGQDARMGEVIGYIDVISNGEGSADLRGIREDYLAVASSVPMMQTADDIEEARIELQRQSRLFSEETKAKVVHYNGNFTTMRSQASAAVQALESSITSMQDYLWLAKESARLTIFNRDAKERASVMRSLSKQGVDISQAQKISEQIDAQRSSLQDALTKKSITALKASNSGLKTLNKEFRTTIGGYRSDLSIEMKRTAILATG